MLRRLLMAAGAPVVTYRSELLFSGEDESTSFIDTTGRLWSTFGDAQIDTSLGDQRGLFIAPGSYITTPHTADLNPGAGPFKIALILRFNSLTGFQTIASKGYTINSNGAWLIQTGNGNGKIIFYVTTGGTTIPIVSDTGMVSADVDYLYEIERVGTTVTLSRDSSVIDTNTAGTTLDSPGDMSIGGGSSGGYNNFWFDGWVKDWSVL